MTSARAEGLRHVDATTPAVLTLALPATPDEARGLCHAVRALVEGTGTGVVVCDIGALGQPGLGVVDLLARLQLAARRAGGRIRLRGPGPDLTALLDLVGLRFEVEGETDEREPAPGVQEAVEPGDPAV
ncbi:MULTISPECIES: STAS domain-containing protein [unclassified Streptomyces]|uniref:STAS domain-containing protein n=1 Tax=unclassified Streptomyces TaxID=2593676 RepID=UPI001F03F22D|nr:MULTISPECIES: STAS domain-containing protein [unclassified Streptomyces]MCH0563880.1 STAS domain-containing protein [Streptomyces sp. MUM 2J]MCH0571435.1 STAS domain-containing protein [Streptomyces sp. MUM 136J]